MKNAPIEIKNGRDRHWDRVFAKKPSSPFASMATGMVIMALGAGFLAQIAYTPAADKNSTTTKQTTTNETTPAAIKSAELLKTSSTATSASPEAITSEDMERNAKVAGRPIAKDARQRAPIAKQVTVAQNSAARGFFPRIKPPRAGASVQIASAKSLEKQKPVQTSLSKKVMPKQATPSGPKPLSLGGPILASEDLRAPAIFFASDLRADRTPPPPLAVALARDVTSAPLEEEISLQRGETFVDALKRAGVTRQDRNAAASAVGKHLNLRRLQANQVFTITTTAPHATIFQQSAFQQSAKQGEENRRLLSLKAKLDAQTKVALSRATTGQTTLAQAGAANWDTPQFDAVKEVTPLTTRLAAIQGRINGSLFVSATDKGAPQQIVADLANMFAYDIDFQRDIFGGDEFEAIFEVKYDSEGQVVGAGDVLFGRLKWRGGRKEKAYYRFAEGKGERADYYDGAGQSAKRLLMKTPIDGARLSSGFGTRRHPILGYRKAHKGVDFAAPRGTPIYAAGDGVVERANRFGSFGNYISIRHSNGYKTAYAHLKGFRKGIRAGKRVRQGDVIGYVGTTGRSTGPHLHYEVHHKGKAVNPQRLKIATGKKLAASNLVKFKKMRNEIDAMRTPDISTQDRLANNETRSDKKEAL